VFGGTYRGLQFSYDERYGVVGLGNLSQLRQVEELALEPAVVRYDLGTGGAYKRSWAEEVLDSASLITLRR
jgi:hypothetical protein